MLLHADNFSIYGANHALMLDGVYAESDCSLVADPDGLSPGRVFSQNGSLSNNTIPFRYVLQFGSVTTLGICTRLWLSAIPSDDGAKFDLNMRSAANDLIARIFVTATGALRLTVDLAGVSTEFTTPIPVVTANGWYHIEWKVVFHATAGMVPANLDSEIRVEGVTVLENTAVPCNNTPIAMMRTSSGNISRNFTAYLKDFVLWDGSGARNNDFLGTQLVSNLAPIADVELNWVPNAGTEGWPILQNVPPDPTEFIAATLDELDDPYQAELSDLPLNTSSVKGIITYVRAAKTNGGDGNIQTSLISNGDAVNGSDRPITVAQTYWRDIFETDPHTAAPWTPSSVNNVTMQINRTV